MPSQTYCNSGDTATVTLPDGSVKSFTDTPIDVTCVESYGNKCELVTISLGISTTRFDYYYGNFYGDVIAVGRWIGPTYTKDSDFVPLDGKGGDFRAKCRGKQNVQSCGNYAWMPLGYLPWYAAKTWQVYSANNGGWQSTKKYRITVTGKSGIILFEKGNFSSNNYSVACAKSCPDGTLDCGDCCLPCDEILTKVCILENLFIGG
jgi:hypothetical protein